MADLTRAEDLIQTIERDDTFRAEIEAAPTATAKRQVLDAHGYQDVGLDEMRAYVESKGGQLIVKDGGRELSDDELNAVAGGAGYPAPDPLIAVLAVSPLIVGAAAAAAA